MATWREASTGESPIGGVHGPGEGTPGSCTHAGTWNLFRRRYVVTGAFDQHLFARAHQAQEAREQGDYEAVRHSEETAGQIVESAGQFIAAVERMIDG